MYLKIESLGCPTTDKDYLINEQYAGMNNYQYRKNIYQYGTNISLSEWLSYQYVGEYKLSNFVNILEIGCGNGEFWQRSAKQELQSNVCITDLSQEMLDECHRNLSNVNIKANFQIADIDKLPFGGETFNAILAHNVIYHAEEPKEALITIYDILQPNGCFGMSVLNYGANQSIWKMANSIESQVPAQSFTARFTNIDADEVLPNVFNQIEKREYVNTLRFESPEPIINMVKSSPAVKPLRLSDNFFSLFKAKIEEQIKDQGHFESELNASLYLCRKNG